MVRPLGSLAVLSTKTATPRMKWAIFARILVCVLVASVCAATEMGQLLLRAHSPNLIALVVRLLGGILGGWIAGKLVWSGR